MSIAADKSNNNMMTFNNNIDNQHDNNKAAGIRKRLLAKRDKKKKRGEKSASSTSSKSKATSTSSGGGGGGQQQQQHRATNHNDKSGIVQHALDQVVSHTSSKHMTTSVSLTQAHVTQTSDHADHWAQNARQRRTVRERIAAQFSSDKKKNKKKKNKSDTASSSSSVSSSKTTTSSTQHFTNITSFQTMYARVLAALTRIAKQKQNEVVGIDTINVNDNDDDDDDDDSQLRQQRVYIRHVIHTLYTLDVKYNGDAHFTSPMSPSAAAAAAAVTACQIYFTDFDNDDVDVVSDNNRCRPMRMRVCEHVTACTSCFTQYIKHKIVDNDVVPWLTCPQQRCNVGVHYTHLVDLRECTKTWTSTSPSNNNNYKNKNSDHSDDSNSNTQHTVDDDDDVTTDTDGGVYPRVTIIKFPSRRSSREDVADDDDDDDDTAAAAAAADKATTTTTMTPPTVHIDDISAVFGSSSDDDDDDYVMVDATDAKEEEEEEEKCTTETAEDEKETQEQQQQKKKKKQTNNNKYLISTPLLYQLARTYMEKQFARNPAWQACVRSQCTSGAVVASTSSSTRCLACRTALPTVEPTRADAGLKAMIDSGVMRCCPKCHTYQMRDRGMCNVMHCDKCAGYWNWQSGHWGRSSSEVKRQARTANTLWEDGELVYQLRLQREHPQEFRSLLERNGIKYDPNYQRGRGV